MLRLYQCNDNLALEYDLIDVCFFFFKSAEGMCLAFTPVDYHRFEQFNPMKLIFLHVSVQMPVSISEVNSLSDVKCTELIPVHTFFLLLTGLLRKG